MDKKTIDTICWWIPFRKLRDAIRIVLNTIAEIKCSSASYGNHDNTVSIDIVNQNINELLYHDFLNVEPDSDTILLIEYFGWHSECLSSYIKYFKDLGYKVVLVANHILNNGWDCRLDREDTIYYLDSSYIFKILKHPEKLLEYKAVFVATFYHPRLASDFSKQLETLYNLKNIFFIEHNATHIEISNLYDLLESKKIFTLSGFNKTQILNPHYFGNINTENKKNNITNFILINRNDGTARYFDSIIQAINKLIKNNITNFKITFIGQRPSFDKYLDKYIEINSNFIECGELYTKIENSDFIMISLNTKHNDTNVSINGILDDHNGYLNDRVSGSYQLSLAFLKPVMIQKPFADAFYFDDSNSIIYDGDDLYQSMYNAITMSSTEYNTMKSNLKDVASCLYNKSLENIKDSLNNL